jgi:DNA helicase-2/ATP-dependent DNA helicase PcrA
LLSVFFEYYQPLLQEKYDDYHKRTNDLESLQRMAARYKSLEAFLTDMALEPPERNIIEPGTRDKDDSRLTLSTIHSAKGLEWNTVFVIYVAEGHLPSYLSLESAEAIEEERRLFYVALTRAKDNLFLLKPHIDRSPRGYQDMGGSIFTQISRFLEEGGILGNLLEMQSAETETADYDSLDHLDSDPSKSKEFLEMMKQHFRDAEDY